MKNLRSERTFLSGIYVDGFIKSFTEPDIKIKEEFNEGDFLLISGKIKKYRNFYFVKDVEIKFRKGILVKVFNIRRKILFKIQNLIKGEIGNIVAAFFLGERELPLFIEKRFQKCGAAHLLAVSGLHTGIVYLVIFLVLRIFPIKRKFLHFTSALLLTPYIFLSGFKIPVIRAYIMLLFYGINEMLERKRIPLNILGLAGIFILLLNPLAITSISFQLSFLSVIGIIISLNIFEGMIKKIKFSFLRENVILPLILTVSAQIFTLPFVVYYFNYIPLYSVFANIILIPLATLIISSMMLFVIFPPLDNLISYGIWSLGFIMNKFMIIIENLPLSTIEIKTGLWIFIIYIPLIFISIITMKKSS
uniref:ComEC/Rec2 family competence protein n=1 Tax=candidate division WOR-3 bacterium TaxID=2052148 RepID=A0A7C4UG53_UNCW3